MNDNDTNNGFIVNGLEKVKMRHKMENKNLLSERGSIYVGTGDKANDSGEITVQGNHCVTAALIVPKDLEEHALDGYVLKSNSQADNNLGIEWVDPMDQNKGITSQAAKTIMVGDVAYQIKVVDALPDPREANTIYFVRRSNN